MQHFIRDFKRNTSYEISNTTLHMRFQMHHFIRHFKCNIWYEISNATLCNYWISNAILYMRHHQIKHLNYIKYLECNTYMRYQMQTITEDLKCNTLHEISQCNTLQYLRYFKCSHSYEISQMQQFIWDISNATCTFA